MEIDGLSFEWWIILVFSPVKVCRVVSSHLHITDDKRWSFGGNRLQIKAERRLLSDVQTALRSVESIGSTNTSKQDLLLHLLENEEMRLVVWLYPLDHERKHFFSSGHSSRLPIEVRYLYEVGLTRKLMEKKANLLKMLEYAWAEGPSLALQFSTRFQIPRLNHEVRLLLLNYPEKALEEPDALAFLLGSSLSNDVKSQLKVFFIMIFPGCH